MRIRPLVAFTIALTCHAGTALASDGWRPTFEYSVPDGAEKVKGKLVGWTPDSASVVWSVGYRLDGAKVAHVVVIEVAKGDGMVFGTGQAPMSEYKAWKKGRKVGRGGGNLPPLHPVSIRTVDDGLQLRTRTTEWTRYPAEMGGRVVEWSPDHNYVATTRNGGIATLVTSPLIEGRIARGFPEWMREELLARMSTQGAVRLTLTDSLPGASVVVHAEDDAEASVGLTEVLPGSMSESGETGPARFVVTPGADQFSEGLEDFCVEDEEAKAKGEAAIFDADAIADEWMRPAAQVLMEAAEAPLYEEMEWQEFGCGDLINALKKASAVRLSMSEEQVGVLSDTLPWFLAQVPDLESVTVDVTSGSVVPDLSWVGDQLKVVNLYLEEASDLSPLAKLRSLRELDIGSTSATDVGALTALPNLEAITVPALPLDALRDSSVRSVTLRNEAASGDIIERLGGLAAQLRTLRLYNAEKLETDRFMALVDLESLTIHEGSIVSTDGLVSLAALQELHLQNLQLDDIAAVGRLTGVRTLNLRGNDISDIKPLRSLLRLEWLDLTANRVSDLGPLSELKLLRHLDLEYNLISDLSPVGALPAMYKLDLDGNLVEDLAPLADAKELVKLDLDGNPVRNASGIEKATKLEEFYMQGHDLPEGWCAEQLEEPIPEPVKQWCY